MHDGRYKTLEEVVDFYAHNIQAHPNLSSNLQTGTWGGGLIFGGGSSDPEIAPLAEVKSNAQSGSFGEPLRFDISEYQKKCLIAYLNTFTDTRIVTDPMYADPFRK